MKLSVVMPCFNERQTIQEIIRRVQATPFEKEIVIVDDCSTDGTREYLTRLTDPTIRVVLHDRNQGKSAALRTGFQHVTGDVVIVQDADLEYHPDDYPILLRPILDGEADVVYGSRFSGPERRVHLFWHDVANKALTTMSNLTTGLNLTDMETGYKVFKTEVVRELNVESERFGFEPEITAKIARRKYRIYEVPIRYFGRSYAEGKKITWRDGIRALGQIAKYSMVNDLHSGHQTLEVMDNLENYARWIWSKIEGDVGQTVLELGSGTGGLTRFLTSRQTLVATDYDPDYLRMLTGRYEFWDGVTTSRLDLTAPEWRDLPPLDYDTVVSSNVLEHVDNDELVLRNSFEVLKPGGRVVMVVPAGQEIYGSIDRTLGHFRRYDSGQLVGKLERAGFRVRRCERFNALGILGWYLNGRVMKRETVPSFQAQVFDRIVPIQAAIERMTQPKAGLSLVAVGEKPG